MPNQPKFFVKTKLGSKVIVAVLGIGCFLTVAVRAQTNHLEIPATEAKNHIHEIATVYGKLYRVWFETGRYVGSVVNATRYVTPIILDVGGYDTNRTFGIVMLDGDNPSFLRLKKFEGKEISVRGRIGTNLTSGLPEMNIMFPSEISAYEIPTRTQTNSPVLATSFKSNASISTLPRWSEIVAPAYDATNTIKTVSGRIYHHAKVTMVEPDGLTIFYTPDLGGLGGVKIPFEDLPPVYQQSYGYDPQQADAYVKAKEKAEIQKKIEQAAREQAELEAKAEEERVIADLIKQQRDEEIKIQTLQAQQRMADANERTADATARQAEIARRHAIIQALQQEQQLREMQRQTWEMQNQAYQQQRTADELNNLNWQMQLNRYPFR